MILLRHCEEPKEIASPVIASPPRADEAILKPGSQQAAQSKRDCFAPSGLAMTIAFILVMTPFAYASSSGDVKKGNMLYNEKKYDEAIKVYDSALEKKPNDAMLRFNTVSYTHLTLPTKRIV